MQNEKHTYRPIQYFSAWIVHIFTGSAVFIGLWSLFKIHEHQYTFALWLMAITVVIDAIDGTFARLVHVKSVLPKIDGTLLDNIVDFLNYVITPCFFLLVKPDMLPPNFALLIVLAITMTSAYQFCQADAKTPDHFFKGFPCYWNISVFYMFIFNTSMTVNAWILALFCILIFVPIKYVYPARLDYLTESKLLKRLMHTFSILYGISSTLILWEYPSIDSLWLALSFGYIVMYLFLSFYRTYSPMILAKIAVHRH